MRPDIELICDRYPDRNRPFIRHFLEFLYENPLVKYIYVAGAISFNRIDRFSDLDVHIVISSGGSLEFQEMIGTWRRKQLDVIIYHIGNRKFPWFGDLDSFFYKVTPIFGIDAGYIEEQDMDTFYFQYEGMIFKDPDGRLLKNVERSRNGEKDKILSLLAIEMDKIVSCSLKIKKNMERKLYWDVFENINQLRRAFVFIYSYENYYDQKFPFIGRPERDIELIWTPNDLKILSGTIPDDSRQSQEEVFKLLTELLLKMKIVQARPDIVEFVNNL